MYDCWQAEQDAYRFKRYLLVTRVYTDAATEDGEDGEQADAGAPESSSQAAGKKAKRKHVRLKGNRIARHMLP